MTNEEILEGNKLIARFMKCKEWPETHKGYVCKFGNIYSNFNTLQQLKFHYSWDWLMPVVDKIESIIFNKDNSFNVTIGSTNFCVIQDSNGEVYESIEDYRESKLLTAYVAVTEFIKWYNKQIEENESSTN